ncbi:phosphatidate phosphatase LPIN2-like isoform X4 [Myxocyprinus asiaticus]|uniref:phosphatidate phosphatase LPIN2-like isoform X4 n=1 Tax=Myxocyprinus asiaticus TaxID=70543 RepID=UPI002222C596|nr:phosphatidate phosphatase LPIN2-like isoform X4 [Myxocyprinus asiaticus]
MRQRMIKGRQQSRKVGRMNYVGQLAGQVLVTVKELYKGLNQATLSGCIDVVVIQQTDGSFQCSPFHVRFGKLGVLHSREKVIDIEVNGSPVDLQMKLGDNGEAFFVEETQQASETIPAHLVTSPIPTDSDPVFWGQESAVIGSGLEVGVTEEESGVVKKKKKRKRKHRTTEQRKEEQNTHGANQVPSFSPSEVRQTHRLLDSYTLSDGDWPTDRSVSEPSSPKSDSELMMKSSERSCEDHSHMQWTWGELPESTKISHRDRAESLQLLSITPSEYTHFRIITDANSMTTHSDQSPQSSEHMCPIIRPQPQTPQLETSKHHQHLTEPHSIRHHVQRSESHSSTLESDSLTPGPPHHTCKLQPHLLEHHPNKLAHHISKLELHIPKASNPGSCSSVRGHLPMFVPQAAARLLGDMTESGPEFNTSSNPESACKRKVVRKRSQHQGPDDIYLDDLNGLEPHIAARYFPNSESSGRHWDEDYNRSGSQSPQSINSTAADSGTECLSDSSSDLPTVSLSLCGGLGDNAQINKEKFLEHIVTYQEFADNPAIIDNPNLVVRIGNRQKVKSAKHVVRTVKRWTNEAELELQACFDCTDWSVFEAAATDLDELTDTVTSYISFCKDMCIWIPTRTYLTFNNDKPWFTAELRQLCQAKEDAYRGGDTILYNQARNTLNKEIRVANRRYSKKLKNKFSANDPKSVWSGMKKHTNYRTHTPNPVVDQQLADDLNVFYCRFERPNLTPPHPL